MDLSSQDHKNKLSSIWSCSHRHRHVIPPYGIWTPGSDWDLRHNPSHQRWKNCAIHLWQKLTTKSKSCTTSCTWQLRPTWLQISTGRRQWWQPRKITNNIWIHLRCWSLRRENLFLARSWTVFWRAPIWWNLSELQKEWHRCEPAHYQSQQHYIEQRRRFQTRPCFDSRSAGPKSYGHTWTTSEFLFVSTCSICNFRPDHASSVVLHILDDT